MRPPRSIQVARASLHIITADCLSKTKTERKAVAERKFFVAWDAPAYMNVLSFEAGRRWARILAETRGGRF
jgi:hypothetical protein